MWLDSIPLLLKLCRFYSNLVRDSNKKCLTMSRLNKNIKNSLNQNLYKILKFIILLLDILILTLNLANKIW